MGHARHVCVAVMAPCGVREVGLAGGVAVAPWVLGAGCDGWSLWPPLVCCAHRVLSRLLGWLTKRWKARAPGGRPLEGLDGLDGLARCPCWLLAGLRSGALSVEGTVRRSYAHLSVSVCSNRRFGSPALIRVATCESFESLSSIRHKS